VKPHMKLTLKNINVQFGPSHVLKNINLQIEGGEIVALLGDNGAGKSTLIKTISGCHAPTSGTMDWNGRTLKGDELSSPEEARRRGVETVYQDLGLVETLPIYRNFFLGRELTKFGVLDHKQMRSVTDQTLREIGVRRSLDPDESVARLSGGERQSVAIARARHFGAQLLILDEPTSALSLNQTEKVLQFIRDAAANGLGVIFITHTLHHVMSLVDRAVVLFQGQKVVDQPITDLNPESVAHAINRGSLPTSQKELQ
jgi:simple sugar transport system ATP-binding protein